MVLAEITGHYFEDLEMTGMNTQLLLSDRIRNSFLNCGDIKHQVITLARNPELKATLFLVDGYAAKNILSEFLILPLSREEVFLQCQTQQQAIDLIMSGKVYTVANSYETDAEKIRQKLVSDGAVLVFDEPGGAVCLDVRGFEKRAISEPQGEHILKGAKDAFVEVLRVNTATVRSKIQSPELCVEDMVVGRQTRTAVAVVYMKNICSDSIIKMVKNKLSSIDIDGVLTSAVVEEALSETKNTVLPQVFTIERPDVFCSRVLEGRVGLLVNGIPISLIVPSTFIDFIQSAEDYSQNYIFNSMIRVLRHLLVFITLFLPGIYISMNTFNIDMLPLELAVAIAIAKQGVPFGVSFQVILMLIAFEVLLEAGLRLPAPIGQAVSIVGAIIIGDSAVNAKLISQGVVIVIAITAISGFAMPNQDLSNALRIWRLVLTAFAGVMGLFGLCLGALIVLFDFSRIENMGVPYLSPYAAVKSVPQYDMALRMPIEKHKMRPGFLNTKNKRRQK